MNCGSSHLWNKKTLQKIQLYEKKQKKEKAHLMLQFPPPRLTKAERLRRNYLISITPINEEANVSTAHASQDKNSQSHDIFSIR